MWRCVASRILCMLYVAVCCFQDIVYVAMCCIQDIVYVVCGGVLPPGYCV